MNEPENLQCPECGNELPGGLPAGLCPRCALAASSNTTFDSVPSDNHAGLAPLPRDFGDYELLEEIARGGMGVVYKAWQKSLERFVAVKMILSGAEASEEMVRRFKSEGTSAAKLQHTNIVGIHEIGIHDGQHFLAMDFVDGPNLSSLTRGRPVSALLAARYVRAIAEAIHAAHESGVLHRDLKPSNVLIDSHDQPRVTDFGLARQIDGESSLTQSGQMLGSPNYMSPEQAAAMNNTIGRGTDVYGLGAILYYLLTGRPPFRGETMAETLHQVLHQEPSPPRRLNPQVPADLETICLKCLGKEPARRYQAALEVSLELGNFVRGEAIKARPLRQAERIARWCRRNPVVATLTMLFIAACTGGAVGWLQLKAKNEAVAILYQSDEFLTHRALNGTNLNEAYVILNELEMAIRHQPENPLLWRARGAVSEQVNAPEEAYVQYSRAIELADGDHQRELRHGILLRRAEVLKRMQRIPEAGIDYRRSKGLPYKIFPADALPDFSKASTLSIDFGFTNRELGLYVLEAEDSKYKVSTRDGEVAWFYAPGANYCYLYVDPTFKWGLSNAVVRVHYKTVNGNPISLHYDGKRGTYSSPDTAGGRGRTGGWEVVEFMLHDTVFGNTQNGGADFHIYDSGDGFYLRRIEIAHHQRGKVPERPALTGSNLLDLTVHYNCGIRPMLPNADLAMFTNIQQIIHDVTGIGFDARGSVRRDEKRGNTTSIPINRRFQQMHFLQAAENQEREGTRIGSYAIQFSDGTKEELPLVYGRNIRGYRGDYQRTPEVRVVTWSNKSRHSPARIQVFVLSWTNPKPELEVEMVEFISGKTRSLPHLLAITLE